MSLIGIMEDLLSYPFLSMIFQVNPGKTPMECGISVYGTPSKDDNDFV